MNYLLSLNQDILLDIGRRIKMQRINQNLTAKKLSVLSGVSLRTISGFERGEKNISLINFIEILRALKLLNHLENLIPELPLISPLEMVALEKKQRKRVK